MVEATSVINEMKKLKEIIEKHRSMIDQRIANAPGGSLRIINKWNKHQYYHRNGPGDPQGSYIPKKEHTLAVLLAQKDYDFKVAKALDHQLRSIEHFLGEFEPDEAENIYTKLSEARKELVSPEFLSDEEYIAQWLNEPYKGLGFRKDEPEFYTAKGERVRSKSEILIADALLRHNIPYRYEYPVYQDGVVVAAPDFNCLNIRLRKVYYWEHLGKMGDPEYADRNVKKLEQYSLMEAFDETKLILTFETDKHPLNTRIIEEKIKRHLL